MADWETGKVDFTVGKFFMAPQKPPMNSGTSAIIPEENFVTFTVMKLEIQKSLAYYLNKARDRLVIAGTEKSAAPMVEIDEALDAFIAHAKTLRWKLTANPMEERMLALEKAVTKSLQEPVHKTAPQTLH